MTTTLGAPYAAPRPTVVEAAALEEAARYFRRAGQHTAVVVHLAGQAPESLAQLTRLSESLLAGAALCDAMRSPAAIGRPFADRANSASESG